MILAELEPYADEFEFEDFELFSGDELLLSYPNCSEIIEKLT